MQKNLKSVLPASELDAQLRLAWLRSVHITTTQLAGGFLIHAKRRGLTTFTLQDIVDDIYHQAVELANNGRNIDHHLLKENNVHKCTRAFLAYAEQHNLIHRVGTHIWEYTFDEMPIHVRPKEEGYDQSPLVYAWNELQELLNV